MDTSLILTLVGATAVLFLMATAPMIPAIGATKIRAEGEVDSIESLNNCITPELASLHSPYYLPFFAMSLREAGKEKCETYMVPIGESSKDLKKGMKISISSYKGITGVLFVTEFEPLS